MAKDKLAIRSELKKKKPVFSMQDSHKKAKLAKGKWRRPKGLQSKMRLNKRGYSRGVAIGYGSPNEVKCALPSGLFPIIVSNEADLKKLEAKTQAAMLNASMGTKKKLAVLKKAKELKITIANVKDVDKFISKVEAERKAKADKKKEKETDKASKKKKAVSKKEKKEKESIEKKLDDKSAKSDATKSESSKTDAVKSDADIKKEEKKEKDRILTKGE